MDWVRAMRPAGAGTIGPSSPAVRVRRRHPIHEPDLNQVPSERDGVNPSPLDPECVISEYAGLSWGQALLVGREMLRHGICLCPNDHIAMSIETSADCRVVRGGCPYCGALVVAATLIR